jgi:hypothetical protein
MNLRNIVWHGFLGPQFVNHGRHYVALLLALLLDIVRRISDAGWILVCRPQISIDADLYGESYSIRR